MQKYCVNANYTIREVMEEIESNSERCAIVINDEQKVIGVISQGDLIRALTSGIDLYARIETIIQSSFLYIQSKDLKKAYKIFKNKKITLLPVIDQNFLLVDVITLDDIYSYLENAR